jgi:hypothetical protein
LLRKNRTNSGRYRVRVTDFFGRFRVHPSVGIEYGGVNRARNQVFERNKR